MSKSEYSTEDFVLDPEFRKWVLTNDLESKLYWEEFLRLNKSKVQEIEQARKILINLSKKEFHLNEAQQDTLWDQINSKIDRQEAKKKETKVVSLDSWTAIQHHKEKLESKRKKKFRKRLIFSAASAAVLTFFLWFNFYQLHQQKATQPVEYETIEALAGVKSSISLPDGTIVTLNSQSKVTYEKPFDGEVREIALVGEAYFDVAKDTLRPFIVKTGPVSTLALGTEFNIQAYPEYPISISLIEGSVLVSNEEVVGLSEKLIPGEGILASLDNTVWQKDRFDLEATLAWMHKTLIFKNTSFKETIHSLEKWYGVEFKITGNMPEDVYITGKFKDESLKNILDGISYSTKYTYSIEGKTVNLNLTR